jgi:hypothetical protein
MAVNTCGWYGGAALLLLKEALLLFSCFAVVAVHGLLMWILPCGWFGHYLGLIGKFSPLYSIH